MTKWTALAVLLGASGALLGACGDDPPKQVEERAIVIGMSDAFADIDPATNSATSNLELTRHIAPPLYLANPDASLVPGLAAGDPAIGGQGKEYVIELRKGLKFADGTACKAQCVKDSLDRVVALAGSPAPLVSDYVSRVEVVEEYKVKLVLTRAVGYYQSVMTSGVYSPVNSGLFARDKALTLDSVADPTKLLGLGPYRIEAIKQEGTGDKRRVSEITLVANPEFYGSAPKTKKLVIKYFTADSGSTPLIAGLKDKTLDIAYRYITLSEAKEQLSDFTVKDSNGLYFLFVGFRCNLPPFDNPKLRQAIAAAISRKPITEGIMAGMARPLYTMVPEGMWGHKPVLQTLHGAEGNVEAAKALLTEAGYSVDKKLAFELWNSDHPTVVKIGQAVKDAVERTGMVTVTLVAKPWAELNDAVHVKGKTPQDAPAPAFMYGWTPDYFDPDAYISPFARTGSTQVGTFYASTQMNSLIESATTETALQARTQLYQQIQDLWVTEMPAVPLYLRMQIVAAQKDIVLESLLPTNVLDWTKVRRTVP